MKVLTLCDICLCISEYLISGQRRPRPPSMCRADGAGLDPPGVSVALCPNAPGVSLQEDTNEQKTPVQDLPLQTGNAHSKKKKQTDT